MSARAQVNADPNKVAMMDTNAMPWEPTEWAGVSRKVLELVHDAKKGRETSLLKFEPGAKIPTHVLEHRMDVFVVEGTYADDHGEYGVHTFLRNQPGFRHTPASKTGCVTYAKWRVPIRPGAGPRIVIDAQTAQWLDSRIAARASCISTRMPTASRPAASATCTRTAGCPRTTTRSARKR